MTMWPLWFAGTATGAGERQLHQKQLLQLRLSRAAVKGSCSTRRPDAKWQEYLTPATWEAAEWQELQRTKSCRGRQGAADEREARGEAEPQG